MKPPYAHLLLPTDGSPLARKGARAGIRLAAALGAKVTVLFVAMPYASNLYGDVALYYAGPTPREHERFSAAVAQKAFAPVEREARRAGVSCATLRGANARPWRGILSAARARKCDAIVMASHGRSGLGEALLGSETQGVLAHSRIPVLVIR